MKTLRNIIITVVAVLITLSVSKAVMREHPEVNDKIDDFGNNIYGLFTDLTTNYSESRIIESEEIFKVNTEKHQKEFSASTGDSSISGSYFLVEKTNKDYKVYVEGSDEPVLISPDKVRRDSGNTIKVLKTTTKVIRISDDKKKQAIEWEINTVLILPESVMIQEYK